MILNQAVLNAALNINAFRVAVLEQICKHMNNNMTLADRSDWMTWSFFTMLQHFSDSEALTDTFFSAKLEPLRNFALDQIDMADGIEFAKPYRAIITALEIANHEVFGSIAAARTDPETFKALFVNDLLRYKELFWEHQQR
jgi:hypothetical protein